MVQFIIAEDYRQLSKKAAGIIESHLKGNPSMVLGLATGSTPKGTYSQLVDGYQQGKSDWSNVTTFNLDEYVGLHSDHPQSYSQYIWNNLFSHINIKKENIHLPTGIFNDEVTAAKEYDEKLKKAGHINLQILGVGANGHIGFNEPNYSLHINTHIIELEEQTITANGRFFDNGESVPRKAITMGLGPIMKAEKILLLASGKEKAVAIAQMLNKTVSTDCPASFLQLHPNVTIIADKGAVHLLTENRSNCFEKPGSEMDGKT